MGVSLILSSAGCGKTTYLISKLKEELASGIDIKKIGFISFTRAAVKVAIQKALKEFPHLKKEGFTYFRTLHSLCFRLLSMTQNRMLNCELINKFESHLGNVGFDLSVTFDESNALSRKNAPLYIHHVALNKLKDIEDIYNKQYYDVSLNDVKYAIKSYSEFKKVFNVFDFNDLLIKVLNDNKIEPLDIDVVFLDEYMDSSLLQHEVVHKLFKNVKRTYIAGDSQQCIFSFAGVDVENFLNLKHDNKIILDTTYRLPVNILDFSKNIVDRISKSSRLEQPVKSFKQSGKIENIFDIENIKDHIIDTTLKGESWLILVRNIYLSEKFIEPLYNCGIPFLKFSNTSYNYNDLEAIINYEDYRKGKLELTDKLKNQFKNYMQEIDIAKNWYEAFSYLPLEESNYYRDIMHNGFNLRKLLKNKPLIEISTIHRVKGREADHVVVLPDMSQLTHKMSEIHKDEEHRVFYVASTRSRKSLFLMEPTSQLYYDLNF